jgi:CRISPR-associated endonuclease Cas3-HD
LEWTGTPKDQELWSETVNALPPAVGELLTVKLRIFKSWLKDELKQDDSSDVLGEYVNNEEVIKPKVNAISRVHAIRRVLAWRGIKDTDGFAVPDTDLVDASSAWRVRPYDIVVIPVECGGWDELGYIPESPQLPDHSPSEIYDAMMDSSAEMSRQQDSQALSRLDIAEQACLLSRAKTVFRAHAKLKREGALRQLSEKMLKEFRKEGTGQKEANWSLSNWQAELSELIELNRKAEGSGEKLPTTEQRLLSWSAGAQSKTKGLISTYPNGVIWITERHNEMLQSIAKLPESCFDGDDLNANQPLSLLQHSADVLAVATDHVAQARLSDLVEQSVKQAALMHDIGKADPRFQARLRGKPLSMIYMLPELLAKSGVDTPKLTPNPLPSGFRHEVVSVGLLDHYCWDIDAEDLGLIRYLVAVHHGYGRPFFPTVVDETPPALDVRSMGGQFVESAVREQWRQEHRVEAGQGMRFWQMNRRFGWWGVTWLEAIVRLADWNASAYPGQGDIKTLTWPKSKSDSAKDEAAQVSRFELIGLDGSNPLGFLAALGCLRTLTRSVPAYAWRLHWEKLCGGWRPVVTAIGTEKLDLDRFLVLLEGGFLALPEEHPALRLAQSEDGLRIGDRFRQVSKMATGANREDADWLSCNGSDLLMEEAISQLQTSRRDYHSINIRGLLKETTREHLVRTLFKSWDYADALAGVSLHLEPREDRRHAYQWHKPSGDPTRGVSGGMIGANRLALEAWPLFQSLPEGEKLRTVGFHGTRVSDTKWRWCLWDGACDLDTIQSLLNAEFVHAASRSEKECIERGVPVVFYCSRILVGKTPNLTPALALESTFR